MTRLLMVVHGLGVHGSDWATDVVADLKTAAAPYGLDSQFSDELKKGAVTIAPITYDDRFSKWLTKWGNDAREMARFIRAQSINVPANITGWLEGADETENNFLWSHIVDVLLYRFFNEVTRDVRVHVARDITTLWRDALKFDPNAEVSVLAHSLGTSVAHDTLALLASDPPSKATGFLAGDRRLANFFQIANISRLLETSPKVYESDICPPSVHGDKAYCGNFINVRHDLDPFTAPRAFQPRWGGDDFIQIRTTAVRDFDVHALSHYLNDPRVHVPILRALFGFEALDDVSVDEQTRKFDAASGPRCPVRLARFVQDCRQRIQLIEDSSEIKTWIAAGVQFLGDVSDVRDACAKEGR